MERMKYVGHRYVDFVNKETGEQIKGVKVFFLTEKPNDTNVSGYIPEGFWYKPEHPLYKAVAKWKSGTLYDAEFGRSKAPVSFTEVNEA